MLHLLRCLSFFEAHFAVSPPILRVWIIHWPMICHYLQVHQRAHAASSRIVSGGAAVQFEARLDIRELERNVRWYAEHGLAESSRRTYSVGQKQFREFCMLYGIVNPLPVCQNTLCLFASHLAEGGLSYGTIKTYLSAVRNLQVANDLEDPRLATMPKLQLVQKGIRRLGGSSGSARVRLPVTPTILKAVKAVWAGRATDYEMILLWAVCCTAFFGFFRLGELLERSSQLCNEVSVQVDVPERPSMKRPIWPGCHYMFRRWFTVGVLGKHSWPPLPVD